VLQTHQHWLPRPLCVRVCVPRALAAQLETLRGEMTAGIERVQRKSKEMIEALQVQLDASKQVMTRTEAEVEQVSERALTARGAVHQNNSRAAARGEGRADSSIRKYAGAPARRSASRRVSHCVRRLRAMHGPPCAAVHCVR
jgi:hypothetical protein